MTGYISAMTPVRFQTRGFELQGEKNQPYKIDQETQLDQKKLTKRDFLELIGNVKTAMKGVLAPIDHHMEVPFRDQNLKIKVVQVDVEDSCVKFFARESFEMVQPDSFSKKALWGTALFIGASCFMDASCAVDGMLEHSMLCTTPLEPLFASVSSCVGSAASSVSDAVTSSMTSLVALGVFGVKSLMDGFDAVYERIAGENVMHPATRTERW